MFIVHLCAQKKFVMFSMSVASILIISLVSLPDTNKQVSSAYRIIWQCFIIELMLLACSVKSRGPRIVPWGIPWFISSQSENVFPSLTRCFRFSRKLCIKVTELFWNPNSANFDFKIRWLIESRAFDKSRNATAVIFPLSSSLRRVSVICRSASFVEYILRKPNWIFDTRLCSAR